MARTKEFDPDIALDAALDLFWLQGYDATSLPDLLDAMGLSRSSLYRTYGDKHALFLKALERYTQQEVKKQELIVNSTIQVCDAIKKILDQIVQEAVEDKRMRGCFLTNTMTELPYDNEVSELLTVSRLASANFYQTLIQKGQQQGTLSTVHSPEALADFLFATILGIRVLARNTRDRPTLQHVADVTYQTICLT